MRKLWCVAKDFDGSVRRLNYGEHITIVRAFDAHRACEVAADFLIDLDQRYYAAHGREKLIADLIAIEVQPDGIECQLLTVIGES